MVSSSCSLPRSGRPMFHQITTLKADPSGLSGTWGRSYAVSIPSGGGGRGCDLVFCPAKPARIPLDNTGLLLVVEAEPDGRGLVASVIDPDGRKLPLWVDGQWAHKVLYPLN